MLVAISMILFVVLGIVAIAITSVLKIKETTDVIHTQFLPLQEAATRAELILQEAANIADDAILDITQPEDYDDVRRYAGRLNTATLGFDMFVKALAWGTESEIFRKSSGGLTFAEWQRAGLEGHLRVPQAPTQIRNLAGRADIYYAGFANNAFRAVTAHKQALRLELVGKMDQAAVARQDLEVYRNNAGRYEELARTELGDIGTEVAFFVTDLRAKIERSQRTIIAIMVILFSTLAVSLFAFTIVFSKRAITDPLVKLAQAAEAIGRGEFETRIDLEANDELRALAGAFNEMAASRKEAEEALGRFMEQLEDRVEQRTTELKSSNERLHAEMAERKQTEQALAQHGQELARSNADLEQFAYVASHDLQEPLRAIAGFTKILGRRYWDKLDADADSLIQRVGNATIRMQALINDLLAYSRVGRHMEPLQSIGSEAVIEQEIGVLKSAIDETGAVVSYDPLPDVVANSSLLGQVFRNLIGNAIKFRGGEPPRIRVSAERGDDEWIFAVQDNGIGLDRAYAERIFVIFQRLNARDEYPGTGIGLAICKRAVERMGGRIWVESQPGKGATFFFTTPIRENQDLAAVASSTATSGIPAQGGYRP